MNIFWKRKEYPSIDSNVPNSCGHNAFSVTIQQHYQTNHATEKSQKGFVGPRINTLSAMRLRRRFRFATVLLFWEMPLGFCNFVLEFMVFIIYIVKLKFSWGLKAHVSPCATEITISYCTCKNIFLKH